MTIKEIEVNVQHTIKPQDYHSITRGARLVVVPDNPTEDPQALYLRLEQMFQQAVIGALADVVKRKYGKTLEPTTMQVH